MSTGSLLGLLIPLAALGVGAAPPVIVLGAVTLVLVALGRL